MIGRGATAGVAGEAGPGCEAGLLLELAACSQAMSVGAPCYSDAANLR